jgi:transcription initiation factor TFIIIB Brf1 subunit/transcription initiation factor TFIIB
MDSHFTFFEKALIMCKNEETLCASSAVQSSQNIFCEHEEIIVEDNKHICIDCGQMLVENFVSNQYCSNIIGMKKRRKSECNIYNDIPSYLPQHVKDKTIEIYQKATANKIFRNTFKKSIILASLHRAAMLTNSDISYDDLLDIFSLKQYEANKGFSYVANNLSKDSEFSISFDNEREEMISIISILRNLGMLTLLNPVIVIFKLVKKRSNILNVSLCKSVICGCVYFWIKYKNIHKTLKEFAQDVKMSEMTIINKYLVISDVVMKSIMKELFCVLLKNCAVTQIDGKNKYKNIIKLNKNSFYGPDKKLLITNPFTTDITVIPYTHSRSNSTLYQPLPLDEVDNIKEWNILLDQKYYGMSHIYTLNVTISKNTRDLVIDFKKYNEINNVDGNMLLKNILIEKFEHNLYENQLIDLIDIKL